MWWESWRRRKEHGVTWREAWEECPRPSPAPLAPSAWTFSQRRLFYIGILFFLQLINNLIKKIFNLFPWQDVEQILVGSDGAARGVVLKDGTEVHSKVVLSNATPYVTFRRLTPQVLQRNRKHHVALLSISLNIYSCHSVVWFQSSLSPEFITAVDQIDYTSPVTKINGKQWCKAATLVMKHIKNYKTTTYDNSFVLTVWLPGVSPWNKCFSRRHVSNWAAKPPGQLVMGKLILNLFASKTPLSLYLIPCGFQVYLFKGDLASKVSEKWKIWDSKVKGGKAALISSNY